jgi:hypothetical protein
MDSRQGQRELENARADQYEKTPVSVRALAGVVQRNQVTSPFTLNIVEIID